MKSACFLLLILILSIQSAFAGDYTMRKKAGDYTVTLTIDRNPPIVAKNRLTLDIRDKNGQTVTDATVSVNYSMPPMQGMAPMNYTTPAKLSGTRYVMTMDLIMAGPWTIVAKINRAGSAVTARFAISVS
jgi:hypothetical protein